MTKILKILKPGVLLLFVSMTACTSHNKKNMNNENNTTFSQNLDTLFSSLFKPDEPGAAVVVMKGDSMVYGKGFGMARLDTMVPVDLNTMFNICSVSKQFSAIALLKLQEQGKLSLDDTVDKYFPNLKAPIFKKITLRHLLSHTSGIPDSRPSTEDAWQEYLKHHESQYTDVHDYVRFCEEEESLRYLETLEKLNFEPGSAYEYMNPTYQMMLYIVEQASGQQFDEWMRENIFLPAGMEQTMFFEKNREIPSMSHGYDLAKGENIWNYFRSVDGKWEECDYGEARFFPTKADGGLYTTPLEFVKWDNAIFNNKLISKQSLKEAHTPRIETDIPYTDYGYGWFIEHRPDRPEKIYHTGDNGGYYIFEGRYPELDLFYLIFATHPNWNREATVEKIDQILLKAFNE